MRPGVVWRTLAAVLTAAQLIGAANLNAGGASGCRLPAKWEGAWFQSGVRQPITIRDDRLSTKGRCVRSEGDKFILVDEKACYRCVVIHEKHANVLQYKETFCHGRESLPHLCSLITGDALLFSMFRIQATPVACPFKAPLVFTYNRGHGECRSPVSSIDTCIDDSSLLLRYQACPDVYGSESTVEELECIATWKEGSSRYLVGKIHHSHATSNEDRYRCFVYDKWTGLEGAAAQAAAAAAVGGGVAALSGLGGLNTGLTSVTGINDDQIEYRVAQSGDATCNGLLSPMEGSRTMTLKKASSPSSKCRFPNWLTASLHWHTLDYRTTYTFHHRNTTLKISNATAPAVVSGAGAAGGSPAAQAFTSEHRGSTGSEPPQSSNGGSLGNQEMRVVCTELKHVTHETALLVTHFTVGCQSGYICMTFYRRDGHVIEVQTGSQTRRLEDACHPSHFNRNTLPYVTLVTSSPESRHCPYVGKFSVTGVSRMAAASIATGSSSSSSSLNSGRNVFDAVGVHRRVRDHSGRRRRRLRRDAAEGRGGEPECLEHEVFTSLVVGCNTMDTMEFRSDCTNTELVSAYSCHGKWEENGTHYLITTPLSRSSHGARRYCFIYRELAGGLVAFTSSADTCLRDARPGASGSLAFNITGQGQCQESSSALRLCSSSPAVTLLVILAAVTRTIFDIWKR